MKFSNDSARPDVPHREPVKGEHGTPGLACCICGHSARYRLSAMAGRPADGSMIPIWRLNACRDHIDDAYDHVLEHVGQHRPRIFIDLIDGTRAGGA